MGAGKGSLGSVVSGNGAGWQTLEINLPDNKDFKELESRISKIEKILCILAPNEELQKRFPALQEAYDHYKVIEKLTLGKDET
jgi:hypothetical protein